MASFLLQALDQIPGASVAIDPITSVFNGVTSTANSIFGGFLGGAGSIFGQSQSGSDVLGLPLTDWFLIGGGGIILVVLIKNKSKG